MQKTSSISEAEPSRQPPAGAPGLMKLCLLSLLQAKCDRHMHTFMKSIRAAAASEGQGFAAVKVCDAQLQHVPPH